MSESCLIKHKVRNLIRSHMSGPSPTCEERCISDSNEWGLLKTTAVVWKGWNPYAHKVPPKQYWNNAWIEVKKGDVLITKAGPRERVGVVVYVDETPPHIMVSGKMIGLRPNTEVVDGRVLAAALSSDKTQRYLDSRTTGMAESQLNFTNELLLETEIELPPNEQQPRCGSLITILNNQIHMTEALIDKYQNIKAGLMSDLFTRGVTADGNLRTPMQEAPELYHETPIGMQPKEWLVSCLGDITPSNYPICYGLVQPGNYVWDGVPIIAIHNLNRSYEDIHRSSNSIESKFVRSRVREGDVLLSIKGTIGRVDIAPKGFVGNVSRDVARVRPSDSVNGLFLKYLLQSVELQRQFMKIVVGSTRMELSINRLKKIPLCIPNIEEQLRITSILENIDKRIISEQKNILKQISKKTGLMRDLLNGDVKVKVAEPDEAYV